MKRNSIFRENKIKELQWWYREEMNDQGRDSNWTKIIKKSIHKLETELKDDDGNDSTEHSSDKNERPRFSWKSIWRKITGLVRL